MDAEVEKALAEIRADLLVIRADLNRHQSVIHMILAGDANMSKRLETLDALVIVTGRYASAIEDMLKVHLDALKTVTPTVSPEPKSSKDSQAGIEVG